MLSSKLVLSNYQPSIPWLVKHFNNLGICSSNQGGIASDQGKEVRLLRDVIEEMYAPQLQEFGFTPEPSNHRFGSMGLCWRLQESIGEGYYWTYGQQNLFDIRIHDFYFHQDSLLEFQLPGLISISWYESISGEELSPYRRLRAGCVQSHIGSQKPCRILVHKKIPIVSIGIEVAPSYYESYLRQRYPEDSFHLLEAFQFIDQTDHFLEMVHLLKSVKDYRGDGIAAKLFYESKVSEAVSLIVNRHQPSSKPQKRRLAQSDLRHLENVTAYIDDHYALELPLERLSKIACMGSTKLKASFRQFHGCTVTEYIQQRRVGQAEHLLSSTDLSIGQVAQAVGYRKASRFSELFRKNTGLLPVEYRKMAQSR